MSPWDLVRALVGAGFVLVVPGLAWSFLLFPRRRRLDETGDRKGLDVVERLALAFGLSVALVPSALFAAGHWLRVPLTTLNVALVVLAVSAPPLGVLALRRWRSRLPRAV